MNKLLRTLSLVAATCLLHACSETPDPTTPDIESTATRPSVFTVNYPLAWLANELGGDTIDVVFPAPGDQDPAFWQPDPAEIGAYQSADLVLLNGASYARWVAKANLSASRLVDTSAGFTDQIIYENAGPVHSHGPEGAHSHGEAAFTVWLDPLLLAQQAEAVAAALQKQSVDRDAEIDARLASLQQTLGGWDQSLQTLAGELDNAPILYSHPVYQYLQRRYQLNGKALHWEPGQLPDEQEWRQLDKLLQQHPARLMLWEDSPLPEVAAQLAERDIAVVVYRPQGNRPANGDFADVMAANLEQLRDTINR